GTRSTTSTRSPVGRTNAWTVTLAGISCAAERPGRPSRSAAASRVRSRIAPLRNRYGRSGGSVLLIAPASRRKIQPPVRQRTTHWCRRGRMKRRRSLILPAALVTTIAALGAAQAALRATTDTDLVEAPIFEVDPLWPKPLPNNWLLGSAIGVGVDSRDHVFVIHRRDSFNERTEIGAATDPPTGECCVPAPNILEFDPEGNLV